MAVCWPCPACGYRYIYASKPKCPRCGRDTSKLSGKTYFVEVVAISPETGKPRKLKRKAVGCTTLAEAEVFEAKLKEQLGRQPGPVLKSQLTLAEFWETTYHPHIRLHNSSSTVRRKEQLWRLYIKPYLGDKPLSRISLADVEGLLIWRRQKGNSSPAGGEVTRRELELLLVTLKHILNLAVKEGIIPTNPASGVKITVEDRKTKWRIPTEEELEAIIRELPPLASQLVKFMAYSGLRWTDARLLTWDQLNLQEQTVTVRMEKTERLLVLPLHPRAVEAVEEAMPFRRPHIPYVFYSLQTGKPYTDLHKSIRRACQRAKVARVPRIHDLRHFFAKKAIEAGVPLSVLKELLGHKSLEVTLTYTHLDLKLKREAIRAMSSDTPSLRIVKGGA